MDQSGPDSRVYSVNAVFDGVIDFVTPVSFTYLIFWWSFWNLLYPKVYVYIDAIAIIITRQSQVSDKKLQRIQRKKYRKLQAQVFKLWGHYTNNQKTATQLLNLNGPMRVN